MIVDRPIKKKRDPKAGWLTGQKRPCFRHFFNPIVCKDMAWLREIAVKMDRQDVIRDIDSGKLKQARLMRCKCGGYEPQKESK